MNDMAELDQEIATPALEGRGWRTAMLVWALVAVFILVMLRSDVGDILKIWWNTDTFGHCLLIPFILAYLVWQRRAELAELTPEPWLPAAGLLLVGGVGWMLGEAAGVALLRHAAVVGMLIVSVPLVFGPTVARGLAFVLFFALFMIPVGDQLIPALQQVTADISIYLLDWLGVPAFMDGVFISIPNGNFEVAEACSGVRFLIAMIAFGVLVANLCFRSWTRRILFVIAAITLSIAANGLRAFGTIYISYLTTPAFAAGVDHVIYGWIFFAIVMVILVAGGWRYFDRDVDDPAFDPATLQPKPPGPSATRAYGIAGILGAAAVVAGPAYAVAVLDRQPETTTKAVQLPLVDGWQSLPATAWKPVYNGASAESIGRYVDAEGQPVELYIAVFDTQKEGAEIVGYRQGLLPPNSEWSWASNDAAPPGGSAPRIKRGDAVRDNWLFLMVNDKLTGSNYTAKIEGLKAKVLGGQTRAAALIISAERIDPLVSAAPAISRFAAALGPVKPVIETATVEEKN